MTGTTNPAPLAGLAAAIAELHAAAGTEHYNDLSEWLLDHPPYGTYASTPGHALRALWADVPIETPFGRAVVTIFDGGELIFDLRLIAGEPFIINGRNYAPPGQGYISHNTISIERVNRYGGSDATRAPLDHIRARSVSLGDGLTSAAQRKLVEWIETKGVPLVMTPERLAARRLYDTFLSAARARQARNEAVAAMRDADNAANITADNARDTLAIAAKLSTGKDA